MQLFESYHFISWAGMALDRLAHLIFYILLLLLNPFLQIISFPKYMLIIWSMRHLWH